MEHRLPAEQRNVTDVASVKDIERVAKTVGVNPTRLSYKPLIARKVAERAGGVAGVGHRNIAQRRASMPDEPRQIPRLACCYVQGLPLLLPPKNPSLKRSLRTSVRKRLETHALN